MLRLPFGCDLAGLLTDVSTYWDVHVHVFKYLTRMLRLYLLVDIVEYL